MGSIFFLCSIFLTYFLMYKPMYLSSIPVGMRIVSFEPAFKDNTYIFMLVWEAMWGIIWAYVLYLYLGTYFFYWHKLYCFSLTCTHFSGHRNGHNKIKILYVALSKNPEVICKVICNVCQVFGSFQTIRVKNCVKHAL